MRGVPADTRWSRLMPDGPATAFPDLGAAVGSAVWTVPALLQARAEASPDAPALSARQANSGWQTITWRQVRDAVAAAARGLQARGLQRGDYVGIVAPSSPQWDIAQLAAMACGAVVVGLDPHDTDQRLAQIAAQCKLAVVIAQDEALLARLGQACGDSRRFAATFARAATAGPIAFADLAACAGPEFETPWDRSEADDAALIVFTSGTTGEPKAIAYTHRQVCGAVASILQAFADIGPGSRLACWLPLSNLFQRMINLCAVGRGAQVFYVADPRTVMEHVADIAPHLFIGVPRFYEKLDAGIRDAVAAKPAWQRALVRWAIGAADHCARAQRSGAAVGFADRALAATADRLALRRIRGVFGADLRYLVSGSAPMPPWLLERLHAMGLLVLEAYGMSECIVPVAANRPQRYKFGTVGQPLAAVEVRLAADGELLLRGPGVFTGYLGEPASERIDADGFFASGDYASIDSEGYITLLGRKSEVFKTSTGRRIAPAIIESQLRRIAYVEHAIVFGANHPFPVAVIAVVEDELRRRLGGRALEAQPDATAAAVQADIAAAVADLPAYQHPAGTILTTRAFSIADGQMTTNLKLRRAKVEARFAAHLDELYALVARRPGGPQLLLRDGGSVMLIG